MKLNSYLLKSSVVAALGGLLFGFDTAVIAGATEALTKLYSLTPALKGLTVSAALWGTVIGAMFGGLPGDKYGRRGSLRTRPGALPVRPLPPPEGRLPREARSALPNPRSS